MNIIENNWLIPYHFNENNEPVVNARDLHNILKSRQRFANWIKSRIEKGGFVEGRDYLIKKKKITKGRPFIEYIITFHMAKHIAMMENNDMGHEARQYFINIDKQYRKSLSDPTSSMIDMMINDTENFKKMVDEYYENKQKELKSKNMEN